MSGHLMASEMREQPARLRILLERSSDIASRVRALIPQPFNGVTIVARGSSDHAAVYGRYLIEAATGKPVSLAAPSLHTLYRVPADYRGQIVIAISQSGATPEIVQTLRTLQEAGGRGLAITNEADSPLARAAAATIALDLGRELAVPATKTVTGQLVAMAIVASALDEAPFDGAELARVPEWIEAVLDDCAPAAQVAQSLVQAQQLVVTARGYMYAAALETALKIKETCYLLAEGYSVADLRHGPIAAVAAGTPVLALTSPGAAAQDVRLLVTELRDRGISVHVLGSEADVGLPADIPEALSPIVTVVRGQQIAYNLARALGHDPDQPNGLNKVTLT